MPASESAIIAEIGRYQVIRTLGQGAMGRVYLAHDRVLERDVAIKILRADLNISDDQRTALFDRMRQEARASARLRHTNIVGLHDMGEHPELGLFLVFEYVEGPSLKDCIGSGGVGPKAAAAIAREVGSALRTAHDAGVLHRDIKPENIIVSKGGAKVADFGIARVPNSTLTRDGCLLGTPAYSAPEAIAAGVFSPHSDQFSLAATLYEAVSLRRAFPGDDAVTVAKRISNEHPPPIAAMCGLDPRVDTVLARALAKNPKARFTSCEEFGRALAESLDPKTQTPAPGPREDAVVDPARFRPGSRGVRIALGGAATGVLLSVIVAQLISSASTSENGSAAGSLARRSEGAAAVGWLADSPRTGAGALPATATSSRPSRNSAAAATQAISGHEPRRTPHRGAGISTDRDASAPPGADAAAPSAAAPGTAGAGAGAIP